MLCYPFEHSRLLKWPTPWLLQPKLDGIRCLAKIQDGQSTLISSTGREITSAPHINRDLDEMLLNDITLDGELYIHGMSFQQINSRVSRTVSPHEDSHSVRYHIFDIISEEPQLERLKHLDELDLPTKVTTYAIHDQDKLDMLTKHILDSGYEGTILRHPQGLYLPKRSTQIMKFKPNKADIYPIIGTQEELSIHGVPKNSLGALICLTDNVPFQVGTGFTREERETLWKIRDSLIGRRVRVRYQELTDGRIPRFPVFSKILF
jgi:ATP-dependent DNA ligase